MAAVKLAAAIISPEMVFTTIFTPVRRPSLTHGDKHRTATLNCRLGGT